jgi:hypothetical protein
MASVGDKKYIVENEEEAIEILKNHKNVDSSISEISIKDDKWKITQVSWEQIARKLLSR